MKRKVLTLTLLAVGCSLMLLMTLPAAAQEHEISGKVTGTDGSPLPGITIQIKGTDKGTTTNVDGIYQLNASADAALIFRGIGYNPLDVEVGGRTTVNVTLKTNTQQLNELVVTALGIQKEAKSLGYAETTVGSKSLVAGRDVNVQQALNGKVSGLNIMTANSSVFQDTKILIRGIRSLTGNNQPMLVVDGAPAPLDFLSTIPPEDIAEVTVLKSAASAAIYGPDAVNGVIIITTKKGGEKPTITFNSTITAQRVAFFPKVQHEYGYYGGEISDMYGNPIYIPFENVLYGPPFDGSMKAVGIKLQDGSIQMYPYAADYKNDKIKFWNTGLTVQNSVSYTDKNSYLSVENANIKGLVPDDRNQRTSLRFNSSKKYGKFSVDYGLNYVIQNWNITNQSNYAEADPNAYVGGLFFAVEQIGDNVPFLNYKDWQHNKFAEFSNYYGEYSYNPYWLIGNIRQKGQQNTLLGNVTLNYQILPWMKATVRANSDFQFQEYKNTNAPIIVSYWATHNAVVSVPGTSYSYSPRSPTQYSSRPGTEVDDQYSNARLNMDYFLSGTVPASSNFKVSYVAGGMLRQTRTKEVSVGANALVVPYLYNVSNRSGDADVPSGNNYDILSRIFSAYGSVDLNYKGWVNIELTGRNDWDSRLLQQNRSFFYPGANVAFVLSQAIPALKQNSVISYLKIRGAISKSGNVNLAPYSLQATYSPPSGFPYGNTVGFAPNKTIPSPDLKPEFVNTKEGGVEMGFLNDRINLQATYFFQENTNQIIQISQSYTTGYSTVLANAADFNNYGVEMDLGLTPLIKIGRSQFNFKINATYNNNQVTHTFNNTPVVVGGSNNFIQVAVGYPTANNIAVVGKPAFAFQLSDYLRDPAGHVIVDPQTGNPSLNPNLVIMGRSLPLWVIGTTLSYSIGRFSAEMTWDYKGGYDFYSGMGPDEDFGGISAGSARYGRQRFVFPNSVYMQNGKYIPNTNVQVADGNLLYWTGGNTNTAEATNYFASAAAWRLREVNISYDLPFKWIGGDHVIKGVTISAVGNNLLLLVPKSNQWGDPEFDYSTSDNTFGLASGFQYPASRQFGGSLTVKF